MEDPNLRGKETEEERKARESRPLMLPRITAPPRCQENISHEVWGTSFIGKRPPVLDTKSKSGKKDAKFYRYQTLFAQPQEPEREDVAPEDKAKKVEWMGNSVVSVAFAAAALVALILVIRWYSPSTQAPPLPQ